MSDRPIQVGDLVVVVNTCCPPATANGDIFRVGALFDTKTMCQICGHRNHGLHAGLRQTSSGVPVPWLKRIPPLEELEGERTQKDMWEPA